MDKLYKFLRKTRLRFKMFFINVLLMIVATVLLIAFIGIGISTACVEILLTPATTVYFRDVALCLDITGNVMCKFFFGRTLITKKSVHHFGQVGETISSVLGKNERDKTLTWLGLALAWILNKIDYQHCYKSIDIRFDTSKPKEVEVHVETT